MIHKLVRIPFDVELAKRIQNKECDGRIFDDYYKCSVRIVDFNFQSNKGKFNIAISERGKGKEVYSVFNDEGIIYLDREDKLDKKPVFMLEIPEYITFKDGDILYVRLKRDGWYVFIYSDKGKSKTHFYTAIDDEETLWIENNRITSDDDIYELRLATESEKQKLIEALKESDKQEAKEYLKRFFGINEKQEYKFNPKDWILCRRGKHEWTLCQFSHINKKTEQFVSVNGLCWDIAIPYNEQTARLLGTTDNLGENK